MIKVLNITVYANAGQAGYVSTDIPATLASSLDINPGLR